MDDAQAIVEFAGKVITTAVVVLGVLWRALDRMITTKVKAQLDAAMKEITHTTSRAVDDLRMELHKHAADSERAGEERAQRITQRIDDLFRSLSRRNRDLD